MLTSCGLVLPSAKLVVEQTHVQFAVRAAARVGPAEFLTSTTSDRADALGQHLQTELQRVVDRFRVP